MATILGIDFIVDRRVDETEVRFSIENGIRASFALTRAAPRCQQLQFTDAVLSALEVVVGKPRALSAMAKLNEAISVTEGAAS